MTGDGPGRERRPRPAPGKGDMRVPIRITSRVNGFRRLGMEHPAAPVEYPDDRFMPEELAVLKADPVLVVEEIPASGVAAPSETPEPQPVERPARRGKRGS